MFQVCLNNKLLLSVVAVLLSDVYTSEASESMNYNKSDWGITQIEFKTIKYTWTITNYSMYDKISIDHLESPIFPGDDDDNKWQIQLFLKDMYNGARNVFSLFLMPLSQDKVDVKCTFALITKDNRELLAKTTYGTVHRNNLLGFSNYAAKDFITHSGNKLLNDDALTISVEIIVPTGLTNVSGHCHFKKSNASHSDNFLSLLENELFSDLKISIGNHQFPVHRAILASVSPVFLSMFKVNQSSKNGIIQINDVDPQIFRELLRFIYTGKVKNLEKIGKDLLPVAERYDVKQLKILCEEVLCRSLTNKSAVDLFTLAHSNDAQHLKAQALNYIAAHTLDLIQDPSYKTVLENSHPLLKIFRASFDKVKTA